MLPSMLFGLLAFTLYGVAMVLMKVGGPALGRVKEVFGSGPDADGVRRLLAIWLVGVGSNFAFAVSLGAALGLGHASAVSALNGFGLVVVAVLSRLFLKEVLGRGQIIGMGLVIFGVALIGYGAAPPVELGDVDDGRNLVVQLSIVGFCLISGVVTVARRELGGAMLGAAAGALGGGAILLQKIFVAPLMTSMGELGIWASSLAAVSSFMFWAWSASATGSFIVLQVAYRYGAATQVAPLMVSTMILVPQIGGVVLFGESLSALQIVGTLLVIVGVVPLATAGESHNVT